MASSRSIRFKISVLVAIPLTSLVALWGFAATVTVGDSMSLLNADALYDAVGKPATDLVTSVEREHLLSAEYLATRVAADRATLTGQRAVTDQARARLREGAGSDSARSIMTAEVRAAVDELTARASALDTVRAKIDDGRIGPVVLAREFGLVPDAMQRMFASTSVSDDQVLSRQSRGIIMIGYSKDFLSRERALAAGALAAGRPLSAGELRLFGQMSTKRAFLLEQGLAELDPVLRAPFAELAASPLTARFTGLEGRLLDGARVPATDWRAVSDDLETSYQRSLTTAGLSLVDQATPSALATFARAGIAGVLGLAAVLASLLVSYRVGRGLTRELAAVRNAATDLAEIRLPRVMEKLRRGEPVDVAVEAPPLESLGSTAEVHDVAAAFDSVQHRAVDSAVEQARLREGAAQSFRNLARRSQSLLQRQLKLLDGMQKQAEDPEALESLFRLDHLTTRMRRHAEGLVILSGGAAGRKWRSSVLMEDVLRGAAAQVEDYARVRIYPMPGTTLVGGAVADMMHLFAEVIENATIFSPPGGEVSVRGELVGRGFTIEIEDRGLGMTADKRAAINERLASPPEFDPAETERLGFAVVGLLAARYGVGVTLRTSPYGGTGVVILLPESLLGDPEPMEPQGPALLEPAESAEPVRVVKPVELVKAVEPVVPVPAGLWKAPQRRGNGGLPRRVRQANISPQLRQEPVSVAEPEERSPEEARALLSSLQAGWRRGRSEGEDNGEDGGMEQ
ncbi:sensor histidine kinase [Streptosporangium sp. CA-135522]|uniref:sensor histidine kinase n=1 Tax=Streptosporangium sp. CA-135522 TaxID=3240072 RepID=UPI003D91C298